MDDNKLTELFADEIRAQLSQLNSIAVPGFGTFSAEKSDEHIETDPASGQQRLCPPRIDIRFKPSVLLRKRIGDE
ncbi:MAG: HU family DNA-binding protein [Clostridium sp.]|nr:HU family DNA-binding protein [Clostridium sp.]